MSNLVPEIRPCLICHHDDGTYSLSIKILNSMVSTTSTKHGSFEVSFFDLSTENMYQIADEIIKAVNLEINRNLALSDV